MEVGGLLWQTGSGSSMLGIAKYAIDKWIDHYSGVPATKRVVEKASLLGRNRQSCGTRSISLNIA
eukprot:2680057-Prorocentrum_lima.AAC.1